MSVKDRIAAKKAAQGVAASETVTTGAANAPATSLPVSPVRSSRAQRFSSAGFVDSEEEPAKNNPVATKPPELAPTAKAPAADSTPPAASRAQRFANKEAQRQSTPEPAPYERGKDVRPKLDLVQNNAVLPWDDPDRPAGTGFSAQEWADVISSNPDKTVFEVLKSSERGLVTKERDANDVVLHRSLVVHEMATCEWRSHTTIKMEHNGEFGRHRYVIIRAENERQKFPWADGSTLVIRDQGYEEEKISPRRERFCG